MKQEVTESKMAAMVNQMTGVHEPDVRWVSFPAVSVRAAKTMIWKQTWSLYSMPARFSDSSQWMQSPIMENGIP